MTPQHRLIVENLIDRKLERTEKVFFKDGNPLNCIPENLQLGSSIASAYELWKINGPPLLGFSHCLCKCGQPLGDPEILKNSLEPRAYLPGHSPVEKGRKKPPARKIIHKDGKAIRQQAYKAALHPIKNQFNGKTKGTDISKETDISNGTVDPLELYRPMFEKVIHCLPWSEFKKVINFVNSLT